MADNSTGEETCCSNRVTVHIPGSGPEDAGSKDLYVRVKDTAKQQHSRKQQSNGYVIGTPKLMLQGVGRTSINSSCRPKYKN